MSLTLGPIDAEHIVLARMAEFFGRGSSWHRRLWTVGTPLVLREVSEYATGTRHGLMKAEGLDYVCNAAARQVMRDPGLDFAARRDVIIATLKRQGPKGGLLEPSEAAAFDEHIRRCDDRYLDRWAEHVERHPVTFEDSELVARLVAGYLLDAGFSADHLHRWLRRTAGTTLADVLHAAAEMARKPARAYQVWIPYQRIPSQVRVQAGDRFMEHADFLALLTERKLSKPDGVRAGAGVLRFDVTAREPGAALIAAELEVRRLRSRSVVGDPGERPETPGVAIVLNASRPQWHKLPAQGKVFLPSLREHSGLFPSERADGSLEDALELLASVETSTTWASLATIWAALEGLLARPGAREPGTHVADRAADLVTCSLPVAELRALLSESGEGPTYDSLGTMLADIGAASWEATTIASHAAALRLAGMAGDPAAVMGRIRCYMRDAFRRLYNQRNMVMHGGRFDSVALPAAMRTMPPLVGAAVDRIVNAMTIDSPTTPLALAARAANELDLVGKPGARSVAQLLD